MDIGFIFNQRPIECGASPSHFLARISIEQESRDIIFIEPLETHTIIDAKGFNDLEMEVAEIITVTGRLCSVKLYPFQVQTLDDGLNMLLRLIGKYADEVWKIG